ncbi:TPA: hypothetical protein JAJ28_003079 [Aeromonas hydrophila]|uniref:Uncharacterized protein n=1 Tax=Aeromonas hydrophila TaxID=644 RepID=A0AAD3UCK7_AERHY|nr:hypothetical protein [Aeromonas hydrophila]
MAGPISDICVSNYTELTVDGVQVTSVQNISGGASQANIIDVFNYGMEYARKLVGSKSTDPFEVTCSYNPSEASYKSLAILAKSNKPVEMTITINGGADASQGSQELKFTGIVASKSVTMEFDTAVGVVYSIVVSGAITETAGV